MRIVFHNIIGYHRFVSRYVTRADVEQRQKELEGSLKHKVAYKNLLI